MNLPRNFLALASQVEKTKGNSEQADALASFLQESQRIATVEQWAEIKALNVGQTSASKQVDNVLTVLSRPFKGVISEFSRIEYSFNKDEPPRRLTIWRELDVVHAAVVGIPDIIGTGATRNQAIEDLESKLTDTL